MCTLVKSFGLLRLSCQCNAALYFEPHYELLAVSFFIDNVCAPSKNLAKELLTARFRGGGFGGSDGNGGDGILRGDNPKRRKDRKFFVPGEYGLPLFDVVW